MNEQYDATNEQANDGLTTQDIVSAGRRMHEEPDARQADIGQGGPVAPEAPPADRVAQDAQMNRQAAQGQPMRGNDARADMPLAPQASQRQDAAPVSAADQPGQGSAPLASLLPSDATGAFQARWDAIQTAFVDEPRQVVEQADSLVAELMQQLAETFAQERARLESQWDQTGNVSTEDLRLALQRYRSFFQRLLSA